jgi:hypothetical protein
MSNKILDNMRDVMRRRHYSVRTERSYCGWVKRFVLHFNMKSHTNLLLLLSGIRIRHFSRQVVCPLYQAIQYALSDISSS